MAEPRKFCGHKRSIQCECRPASSTATEKCECGCSTIRHEIEPPYPCNDCDCKSCCPRPTLKPNKTQGDSEKVADLGPPAESERKCPICGRGICAGCNHWRDDEETLETN